MDSLFLTNHIATNDIFFNYLPRIIFQIWASRSLRDGQQNARQAIVLSQGLAVTMTLKVTAATPSHYKKMAAVAAEL